MALFRKLDFSLGRGAEWGAQERWSKPIRVHTRAGCPSVLAHTRRSYSPGALPGAYRYRRPTHALPHAPGYAWAPGNDLEIFPMPMPVPHATH